MVCRVAIRASLQSNPAAASLHSPSLDTEARAALSIPALPTEEEQGNRGKVCPLDLGSFSPEGVFFREDPASWSHPFIHLALASSHYEGGCHFAGT